MSAPSQPRDRQTGIASPIILRSLALLFLIAFIGIGLEGIRRLNLQFYLRQEPAGLLDSLYADQATDAYFRELLVAQGVPADAVRRPTRALRSALSLLPKNGSTIVIVPRDLPEYGVMCETIRYLSVPRYVYYFPCDHPERAMIPADEKIAAIFLYVIDPPAGESGNVRIMPRLTMIEMRGAEQWKSYCSR
jgi:hypothetical protein